MLASNLDAFLPSADAVRTGLASVRAVVRAICDLAVDDAGRTRLALDGCRKRRVVVGDRHIARCAVFTNDGERGHPLASELIRAGRISAHGGPSRTRCIRDRGNTTGRARFTINRAVGPSIRTALDVARRTRFTIVGDVCLVSSTVATSCALKARNGAR